MTIELIPSSVEQYLTWAGLCAALEAGHRLSRADIQDVVMYRDPDTLLSRHAWIDGLGIAVKTATVFPGNKARGKSTTGGGVSLYSDADGSLEAIVDFHVVTKWKTAGDSLLAASKLARPDSRGILIVGAGTVASSLVESYGALFPDATFTVWSRTQTSARDFAATHPGVQVADNLEEAVRHADIVACATMAHDPLIRGAWLQPGQHIDLIGAYRPDMREVDDAAMQRSRIFVDSRDTTLDHIGELMAPLASGAIERDDIVADFYDMASGTFTRETPGEITLFKNGGGAHLDLMTSKYIAKAWRNR